MLVFEVTDGVTTPEEITPYEGKAHVSGDKVFSFIQFLSTRFPYIGVLLEWIHLGLYWV